MKSKSTLIYLLSAIILLAILLLFENPFSKTEEKIKDELKVKKVKVLDKVSEADTSKIFISRDDGRTTATLYQVNNNWYINEEGTYAAEKITLRTIWESLSKIKQGEVVSTNPQNYERFNLGKNATNVTFYDKGGKVADEIIIGKNGPDYQSSYIRRPNKDAVLKVPGMLTYIFSRGGPNAWREREMIKQDINNVTTLNITGPDTKTKIVKLADESWEVFEPKKISAMKEKIESAVRGFSNLRAVDFEDNLNKKPLSEFGLNPPVWTISTYLKDHSSTPTLFIGKSESQDRYYAKVKDKNQLFLINKFNFNQFCQKYDYYLPTPTPLPAPTPKPSSKAESKEEKGKKKEEKEKGKEIEKEKEKKSDAIKNKPAVIAPIPKPEPVAGKEKKINETKDKEQKKKEPAETTKKVENKPAKVEITPSKTENKPPTKKEGKEN